MSVTIALSLLCVCVFTFEDERRTIPLFSCSSDEHSMRSDPAAPCFKTQLARIVPQTYVASQPLVSNANTPLGLAPFTIGRPHKMNPRVEFSQKLRLEPTTTQHAKSKQEFGQNCANDPITSCAAVETATPRANSCANNAKNAHACGAWNNRTTCLSGVSPPKAAGPKCVESRESAPSSWMTAWKLNQM